MSAAFAKRDKGGAPRQGLIPSRCQHKIKARGGEGAKVTVPRKQGGASIDTTLGDQRIAEPRLAPLCEDCCSQRSSPLPVAGCDLDGRYFGQGLRHCGRKLGVAQQFREHNRHHHHLPLGQRAVQQLHLLAFAALQKSDSGAGVGSDQRSAFSSASLRVNRTLPRSWRRRA